MRISEWSSDVCSSDLAALLPMKHCPKCRPRGNDGVDQSRLRRHGPPSVARSCGLQDRSDPQYTTGTSAAALDAIALPETAPAIAPDRSASSRPPPSHVIRQPDRKSTRLNSSH